VIGQLRNFNATHSERIFGKKRKTGTICHPRIQHGNVSALHGGYKFWETGERVKRGGRREGRGWMVEGGGWRVEDGGRRMEEEGKERGGIVAYLERFVGPVPKNYPKINPCNP
jgi:hypothetical protein